MVADRNVYNNIYNKQYEKNSSNILKYYTVFSHSQKSKNHNEQMKMATG